MIARKPKGPVLWVEGRITAKRVGEPLTYLAAQAPEEAVFDLTVERAGLSDGTAEDPMMVFPTEFAGDLALLERFQVGQRVRITCTTATGRLIAGIKAIEAT